MIRRSNLDHGRFLSVEGSGEAKNVDLLVPGDFMKHCVADVILPLGGELDVELELELAGLELVDGYDLVVRTTVLNDVAGDQPVGSDEHSLSSRFGSDVL